MLIYPSMRQQFIVEGILVAFLSTSLMQPVFLRF